MDERENKLFGKDPREILSGDVPGDMGMGVLEKDSEHDITSESGREEFTNSNPELKKFAEDTGRDLVAFIKGRKVRIWIGAGIAAAGIIGGIVLYEHKQKNKELPSSD